MKTISVPHSAIIIWVSVIIVTNIMIMIVIMIALFVIILNHTPLVSKLLIYSRHTRVFFTSTLHMCACICIRVRISGIIEEWQWTQPILGGTVFVRLYDRVQMFFKTQMRVWTLLRDEFSPVESAIDNTFNHLAFVDWKCVVR